MLLPILLESLERHSHLALDLEAREKLLTISGGTIDRLLAPMRATSLGKGWRRPARTSSAVQRCGPGRRFNGWSEWLCLSLRGIDLDNDGASLNPLHERWFDKQQLRVSLTCSRTYHSNDRAWMGNPGESQELNLQDYLGAPG
ncbi:MAG TPA: hypothetical protein DDY43_11780 [Synechococcales bacterium UBA10510]|nr:hypothetical protein [Synechococcales bacterium UBA10510]